MFICREFMVRSLFVPSGVSDADAVRSPSDREPCSVFFVGPSQAYGVVGSNIPAAGAPSAGAPSPDGASGWGAAAAP